MKKRARIFLIIFCILTLIAVPLLWFQRENLMALRYYLTYSKEEINEKIEANDKAIASAFDKVPDFNVRDLTGEEKEKLISGELSQEDAVSRITGTSDTDHVNKPTSQTPASPFLSSDEPKSSSTPAAESQVKLEKLIAQIYIYRATYICRLENLRISAIEEYQALPQERHTEDSKWDIGLKYLNLASDLEATCDKQMEDILSQVKTVLEECDGDQTLLEDIRTAYINEKELKKAYYLSLYR